jgi:hypothetical protein
MVRILVNDAVQPLEFCGGDEYGRCTLSNFVESQEYAKSGGEWTECWMLRTSRNVVVLLIVESRTNIYLDWNPYMEAKYGHIIECAERRLYSRVYPSFGPLTSPGSPFQHRRSGGWFRSRRLNMLLSCCLCYSTASSLSSRWESNEGCPKENRDYVNN